MKRWFRIEMSFMAAAVMFVAVTSVWASGPVVNTTKPPKLVANLLNSAGKAEGSAVFTETFDAKGIPASSSLTVTVTPLSKDLVGKKLTVKVGTVVVGTATVQTPTAKSTPSATLSVTTKAPTVSTIPSGAAITVIYAASATQNQTIAQGTFVVPK